MLASLLSTAAAKPEGSCKIFWIIQHPVSSWVVASLPTITTSSIQHSLRAALRLVHTAFRLLASRMIVLGEAELYIVVINPIRDQPVKALNANNIGKTDTSIPMKK